MLSAPLNVCLLQMLRLEGGEGNGKPREFQAVLLEWSPKEVGDQWRIKVIIQVH